ERLPANDCRARGWKCKPLEPAPEPATVDSLMDVLARIVAAKRAEVARSAARLPEDVLRRLVDRAPPPRSLSNALRGGGPHIIAEVKRASPSHGVLRPGEPPTAWQAESLARAYEAGGARALSVLTDVPFFWGSADALVACRAATALPVLRKDFILEPY